MIDALNKAARRVPAWPGYIVLAVPSLLLWQAAFGNRLGADPVKALEHEHGMIAMQLLIATLLISPLRRFAGVNLLKFRRMLGLMCFAYGLVHFGVYLWLDLQFFWGQIWGDLIKRPYIVVGWIALLAMLPLAATSSNLAIRRLGAGVWQKLHRLIYPAAILVVLHYLWLVKSWTLEPLSYAVILLALVALRLFPKGRSRRNAGISQGAR